MIYNHYNQKRVLYVKWSPKITTDQMTYNPKGALTQTKVCCATLSGERKERNIPMSIFHCHVKNIGRSGGKSAVASSSYRAGEQLENQRDGKTHNYSQRTDVVYKEILTPRQAPEWAKDRERLWNEVEKKENRINSRFAKDITLGLQKEFDLETNIQMLKAYLEEHFVNRGLVADVCIHDKDGSNPHAHVMITLRPFEGEEWSSHKDRHLDKKENLEEWRKSWAEKNNQTFQALGLEKTITEKSFEERGLGFLQPTKHVGPDSRHNPTRQSKIDQNKAIRERNYQILQVRSELRALNQEEQELIQAIRAHEQERTRPEEKKPTPQASLQPVSAKVLEERRHALEKDIQKYDRILRKFRTYAETKSTYKEYMAMPDKIMGGLMANKKKTQYYQTHHKEIQAHEDTLLQFQIYGAKPTKDLFEKIKQVRAECVKDLKQLNQTPVKVEKDPLEKLRQENFLDRLERAKEQARNQKKNLEKPSKKRYKDHDR